MHKPWIAGLLLVALLIAFRCLGAVYADVLPNFSPLPALFICSVVFFRGKQAWLLPIAIMSAWLISSPIVSILQGYSAFGSIAPILTAFIALLAIGFLALPLRKHRSAPVILGAGLVAAVIFHLFTGVAAWLGDPRYLKTAGGLVQALWTGSPIDVLPSWAFLRNLAAANILFTTIFLAARYSWSPRQLPEAQTLPQSR